MVDYVLLAVLALSMLLGAWRGLVYEVVSVLAWVAAFVMAQWLAPDVAPRLPLGGASDPVRYGAAFATVFVATVFAGGLLAWLVRKLVEALGMRPADRTLGAAFGLLRGVVLLLAATLLLGMTPARESSYWRESVGVAWLSAALKGLKPVMPEGFRQYLP